MESACGFQSDKICLVIRFCLGKRDKVAAVPSAGPEESGETEVKGVVRVYYPFSFLGKKNAWATLTETCVARGNQGCCHEASVDCGEEATCHSCIYLTVLPSKLRRREQQHDRR